MHVYLVQHGQAVSKEEDPDRPLSIKGREDVERLARHLATTGIRVTRVIHSGGKTRARQTGEILGVATGAGAPQAVDGINPKDPPDGMARELRTVVEDTLIAGHQPFMGNLVSRLLTGREDGMSTAYLPGGVVCLEKDEEGNWSLQWMLRPELLGGGAV